MSIKLLLLLAVLDAGVGIDLYLKGRLGMAVVWSSYASACLGFAWDVYTGGK